MDKAKEELRPTVKKRPTNKRLSNPVLPADQTWQCTRCTWILGYLNPNKTILTLKFKDLYIYVEEAKSITEICRRCGEVNTLKEY